MTDTHIYQLQLPASDYMVGISFMTGGQELRILSDDRPRDSLYRAAATVAELALQAVHVSVEGAVFKSISFTDDASRVELAVGTSGARLAKLTLPSIDKKEILKVRREGSIRIEETDVENPQNLYNAAVAVLKAEALDYIHGRKEQIALEFDEAVSQ